MSVLSAATTLDSVLRYEQDKNYSREEGTIAAGNSVSVGQVLGMVTASGKYAVLDPAAEDGSDAAVAISYADYEASSADVAGVVIVRGVGVLSSGLVWGDDVTAEQKTTALAELKALGIITLEEA